MLATGLAMLLLGSILLAIPLRGRIVARGRFCRKCRFDLEGHSSDAAACPECGRDLTGPKPTRVTLRRVRPLPLVAAGLLLFVGLGLLLIQTPGAGARIIAGLPDAQVVRLAAIGVDAGVDELASRATRMPPMASPDLARAMELALAHQADASKPWDPRWGEVLAGAFFADRMTDDQIARYLTHGFEREIQIRDRVNRPDARIGYRIDSRPVRLHRLTSSQPANSNRSLRVEIVSIGATSPGANKEGPGGAMSSGMYIPNQPPTGDASSLGSTVPVRPEDWTAEEPHDELTVRAEFRVTLEDRATRRKIEVTTVESEQRVRLLPPDEPAVTTITDAAAAERAAGGMGIEPFAILPVLPNTLPPGGATIAQFGFRPEPQSHAVAGWLSMVDPRDNSEVRITRMTLRPPGRMAMIDWRASHRAIGEERSDPERMLSVAEAVLAAGTATLVFRTDPAAAESDPDIDAVLDMTVVSESVPVHRAQTEADLNNSVGGGSPVIRGRLADQD